MANAEQRANSAKEDKNWMQDAMSLLSRNYCKMILVLSKDRITIISSYSILLRATL